MTNEVEKPVEKPPEKLTGLDLMRAPFPESYISKLPKGTKAQNECPPDQKINCPVCGGWHHPKIIHLDYVGHAAVTQRLLDSDPNWHWEPLAYDDNGLPKTDEFGGLWIKLTVAGMTRLGYGDSGGKVGTNAVKELIGDALRNAAMRFGVALELWHKGDWENSTVPEPTDESVITDQQAADLNALLDEVGADKERYLKAIKCESLADILSKNYDAAVKLAEMKRKAQK